MMFEQILKELRAECSACKKECTRYDCIVYRVKKLIQSDIEIDKFNIDDFFTQEEQMPSFSLFEGLDI